MRKTGLTRIMDPLGRVTIPSEIRELYKTYSGDSVEIMLDEKNQGIIIRKYVPNKSCMITGEITSQNKEIAEGIIVSPTGAMELKKIINEYLKSLYED
jgi:AbrB family transcriptional regulator, transcriptional pleiotropic regulator of transition state genes